MVDPLLNAAVGLSLSLVVVFTLLSVVTLRLVAKAWPKDTQQTSYKVANLDNTKENIAYGVSLHEIIQTEENEAYTRTNHEQIQFEANQAYGTADHEKIRTKHNEAYEDKLLTKENEAYASASHERIRTERNEAYEEKLLTKENVAYASASHEGSCQMRQNQAYIPTNPEQTQSSLPSTAAVDQDEREVQFYERISLNDESAPTQQLEVGGQPEGNDETYYDYITQ